MLNQYLTRHITLDLNSSNTLAVFADKVLIATYSPLKRDVNFYRPTLSGYNMELSEFVSLLSQIHNVQLVLDHETVSDVSLEYNGVTYYLIAIDEGYLENLDF